MSSHAAILKAARDAGRRAGAAHARGERVESPGSGFEGPLLARQGVSEWYRGFAETAERSQRMTDTWAARYTPPHMPAGSPAGGQFAPASGSSQAGKNAGDKRPTPGNQHPVGTGETGKRVSDLQKRLNALGFKPPLKVDGVFGPKTRAAVEAFQRSHGLKVDGLVGPKTTAALRGGKGGAAKPSAGTAHAKATPDVKSSGAGGKLSGKPGSITSGQQAEIRQLVKDRKVPGPDAAGATDPAAMKALAASEAQALIKHLRTFPARTATRALTHEPLGKPGGPGLFHHKGMQLPAYIQHIARDLMESRGMPESEAIATAVSMCKKWAAGGQDVKPETRAKAAAAVAEWERLRGQARATRSEPVSSGYDEDGLDGSWDDLDGLPDLAGLGVADFEAAGGSDVPGASRAAKLGSGARFRALKAKLAAKGASDPGALAAHIGRRKYGKAKFTALASAARKKKGGRMSRSELLRTYPLEDIHILTRAEGDGSGRVVEAYATVFDTEAEIRDSQGHYKEIIDRSAFDQVLGRIMRSPGGLAAQVKVLFNHGRTMGGVEAPEFQLPLGKPLDVRPEQRGLLTRTEYDAADPFTERVLSKIHAGTITAQSFVGGIIRSAPELSGPGARYRGRNGVLPTVRRMVLGLREYGPVLYPAYTGAEILGVRMSIPGAALDDEIGEGAPDSTGDEEYVPAMEDMEDDGAGGTPGEVHPSRDHAHRLYALRTEQMLRDAGIASLKGGW